MNDILEKNELFKDSHLMILKSYSIFAVVLVTESLLMGWERWAILLILAGIVGSWGLHFGQILSDYHRLWVYSILMMVTYFFYGIHLTSTFDMALVMSAVIVLYIMTGIKAFVTLCQLTFYVTFVYDIISLISQGEVFDTLAVTRSLLHVGMITMLGWLGRAIIVRCGDMVANSRNEINELKAATTRFNDFLSNVSHEIRTPVNAIMGFSDICMKKEKDPEILEDIRNIKESGKRVCDQIEEILDYSEIDRNKIANNCENYMISSLFHDLVTELRDYLPADLELIIDVSPSIPSVLYSDHDKIKRILWHLITNGIKYTSQGGVYVRVTSSKQEYGINLCIEVTDTGAGMDKEQKDHIYDGFYQGNSGRARSSNGLGLGMSVVAGFVASLGGFITIDSTPAKGTTVRVSIPQKVIDESGCMSLRNRQGLRLGSFLQLNSFAAANVRQYYNSMVMNIVKGLGVQMVKIDSLEKLKELTETESFTHIFVGRNEYEADSHFMEELAKSVKLIVVADKNFRLPSASRASIMEKPFYCFPVVSVLNIDMNDENGFEKRMMMPSVRALVVDDEPMNLTVAEGLLRYYGITVSTAASGFEAIHMCQDNEYDLVFMDHMMPGMDGVEAMRKIRAVRGIKDDHLPIIALTANTMSTAREMFASEGFDGFVSKPINLTELERVMKKVIPERLIEYVDDEEDDDAPIVFSASAVTEDLPGLATSGNTSIPGVDMEEGLKYTRGDMEFYRMLMSQYVSEAPEKKARMDKAMAEGDIGNFEIIVHGIKSSSKMLGAMDVSEQARMLENNAEEGSLPDESGYAAFLSDYLRLTDGMSDYLKGHITMQAAESKTESKAEQKAEPKEESKEKSKKESKTEPKAGNVVELDGEIFRFPAKKKGGKGKK
ncbi:MAG: response regulator [Lachnospiraceae bacterium]|nr:response regulator [Lachnospiraceae bacterium]